MTSNTKRTIIQYEVIRLAVTLHKNQQTMTTKDLVKYINNTFPNLFPQPYVCMRGVLTAAYNKCKNQTERNALVSVFTSVNGKPLVK